MKMITRNLYHKWLATAIGVCGTARLALSSAFFYKLKREAFGAPILSKAVVRHSAWPTCLSDDEAQEGTSQREVRWTDGFG